MKDISDHYKPKVITDITKGMNLLKQGLKLKMNKEVDRRVNMGQQARKALSDKGKS